MRRRVQDRWRDTAMRDLTRYTRRADLLKEGRCVSRSGYVRGRHTPDKDGVCVFCDTDLWRLEEAEEAEGEEDAILEDGQAR